LIVIVGPTAVGKTELSIRLAECLDGEIVSADSRLFYRGMDIGTAKPTAMERARVPHHLIDVADPDETWSLPVFQKAAAEALTEIHRRGRLPFLVGGTGQYVHAVTHAWTPPSVVPDTRLRAVLDKLNRLNGYAWLHARLQLIDPVSAANIDPRNTRRTIRALEIIFSTGKPASEQRGRGESPYRMLSIGLTRPRPELYARIDARIEAMFAAGFLDEVCSLLAKGYSPHLPTMSAIGYRECVEVIQGGLQVEEAIRRMKRSTRVFVRRQANWFRIDDPAIRWFEAGRTSRDEIEAFIRSFLRADKLQHAE